MTPDRAALVRALNDELRTKFCGGRVLLTPGVTSLGEALLSRVLVAIQSFQAFDADNDPYDEHDFGSVEVADHTIFWKIDYYDNELSGGAEDPTDPRTCVRVLTIMLAEEY